MFSFFEKSDDKVQTDVMSELKWDPRVTTDDISVTAKDGVITLRGSVPHFYEKHTAEEAVRRVGGVRGVADEITVKIRGVFEKTDGDIAQAALQALKWNYAVPPGIQVLVDDGFVTLMGEADWEFERSAAQDAVGQLLGVCGVKNDIKIKTRVQVVDVKNRIEEALERAAEIEGRKISVSVDRDKVTLSGDVHSYSEIADAGMAAWNAPGVMSVQNDLKIAH